MTIHLSTSQIIKLRLTVRTNVSSSRRTNYTIDHVTNTTGSKPNTSVKLYLVLPTAANQTLGISIKSVTVPSDTLSPLYLTEIPATTVDQLNNANRTASQPTEPRLKILLYTKEYI